MQKQRIVSIVTSVVVLCLLLVGIVYLWRQGGQPDRPVAGGSQVSSPQDDTDYAGAPGDRRDSGMGRRRPNDNAGGVRGRTDRGGGGFGGPGVAGGGTSGREMFARMRISDAVSALGQATLSPDFELTAEQKGKIQAIRDEYRTAAEPNAEEFARKLRAILTADQIKALDAQAAQKRTDDEQRRQMFGGGFGGGFGGPGGGPGAGGRGGPGGIPAGGAGQRAPRGPQ